MNYLFAFLDALLPFHSSLYSQIADFHVKKLRKLEQQQKGWTLSKFKTNNLITRL